MNHDNGTRNGGFTIVELMIAMAFIAFLLLAIAAAIMQVAAIYNKGVTMKSVNQSGRLVVADMRRTISEGPILTLEGNDGNSNYRPQDHNRGSSGTVDYDGGRLCTGSYSYVWNIGKYANADPPSQRNNFDGVYANNPLRLVRVTDEGGSLCKGDADGPINHDNATELLSETNLAVQKFDIKRLNTNRLSGSVLYEISIFLSDSSQTAIQSVDLSCRPPSDSLSSEDYCAVNEFVFTVLTGKK